MKKILFATLFLAACGGSSKQPQEPKPEPKPMRASVEPEQQLPEPSKETLAAPNPMPDPVPAPEPAPVPEPPKTLTATAALTDVKSGDPMGTVTFERGEDGMITITAELTGLKKNSAHAFYIHENGDCSAKGKKVGAHLNPTKAKHGPPASSERHAGDFGNVTADETGHVTFTMMTDSITMDDIGRADTIINRSVVIHTKKDDKKGSAGAPLACGVITLQAE
jgi:Cu-Zn family superoxide dismutase